MRGWAITGTGLISGAGDSPAELFEAALAARAPRPVPGSDLPHAPLAAFDARRYLERKGLKHLSRTSQLACAAAAGLQAALGELPQERIGVVLGSAWASLDTTVRFEREAHVEGPRFVDPGLFAETVANVAAGQVSIFFGWAALNATVVTGSASGLAALLRASELLAEQRADVVVAGGADELNRHLLETLHAEGLLAPTVGSEGACLLAIESPDHAAGRGAAPCGRLLGGASRFVGDGSDAELLRAELLRATLDRAGLGPRDVGLLVLSAAGHAERDAAELALVRDVFGERRPPILAPKAFLGETWAASGPLGIVLALESMRRSTIPAVADRSELGHAVVLDTASDTQTAVVVAGPE